MQDLPVNLRQAVELLARAPRMLKTEMLLEFARSMPTLPPGIESQFEQVHECTTPLFVYVQVDQGQVHPYFEVPQEAPTVRAFAGLLAQGLGGCSPQEVLRVPTDFYRLARLEEIVTPLRLRGLEAVLRRIKRQITDAGHTATGRPQDE